MPKLGRCMIISLTLQQIEKMRDVDMRAVDINSLVDVSALTFDSSLSRKEREDWIIRTHRNPYCFRYGDMGVKIEFTDDGPPLQDLIIDFMQRKKSGL
ncbi:MAG TPA: hypothetical protein VN381_12900 [Anaerovoracaceae bacterium]|nr:hypothetical protein [Anaerovoracaceae bacterium]